MLEFMKKLTHEFRKVTPQAYHDTNTSEEVTYPYLVFDIDSEALELSVEGFYIDVDIFDYSSEYTALFELEEAVKKHFDRNYIMTDEMYLRFAFLRSIKIPVADERLKRRHLQLYCKVDWRSKNDD